MREQFKLHENIQEETKDTTSGKFSEQVVQGWKLQYNVARSKLWETDGI